MPGPSITNTHGQPCRSEWEGSADRPSLKAEVAPGACFCFQVARVKQKNDGRWHWRICNSGRMRGFFAFPIGRKLEGVAATKWDAMRQVESHFSKQGLPHASVAG